MLKKPYLRLRFVLRVTATASANLRQRDSTMPCAKRFKRPLNIAALRAATIEMRTVVKDRRRGCMPFTAKGGNLVVAAPDRFVPLASVDAERCIVRSVRDDLPITATPKGSPLGRRRDGRHRLR